MDRDDDRPGTPDLELCVVDVDDKSEQPPHSAPRRVGGQARRRSRTLSARARRINVASDEGDQIGGSWRFTESAFRL